MGEDTYKTIAIILLFVLIFSFSTNSSLKKKNSKLENQISLLVDGLDSYRGALNEANSNIEDAQWYAWSSYDDMGYALDNLETVEP